MSVKSNIITDIYILEDILFGNSLTIPVYQRPYKWTTHNVNQLIDDILIHNDKTAYRLGTIVLHNDGKNLNVVDGQQRLFTLSLVAFELLKTELGQRLISLKCASLSLSSVKGLNSVSIENLKRNQQLIRSRINEFGRDDILFFFQKCQVVYIELAEISEAFQFFDSQNTRGKDLEPHDLLKAFHLREMRFNTEQEKIECVRDWEEVSDSLSNIFSNYLFRIRRWSKGYSGLNFSKKNVNTFKGVSFNENADFNYLTANRISHFFIENYNADLSRNIDRQKMSFPFQIDQIMINGKRFFEYVHFYSNLIIQIENIYNYKNINKSLEINLKNENSTSKKILNILRTYGGQNRIGDKYVRNVFDCSLLYYWDKFGTYKMDEAVVKFFLWSYKIRLENQAVQEVTCDNYSRENYGIFRLLREAIHPSEILYRNLPIVNYVGDKKAVKDIESIVNIFIEFNLIND